AASRERHGRTSRSGGTATSGSLVLFPPRSHAPRGNAVFDALRRVQWHLASQWNTTRSVGRSVPTRSVGTRVLAHLFNFSRSALASTADLLLGCLSITSCSTALASASSLASISVLAAF